MARPKFILAVLALVGTAMLGLIVHRATAPGVVSLEQSAAAGTAEDAAMAKYEKQTHDDDQQVMANAARMNDRWGGTFKNGVASNTWKGTPWGKYDDAVARRGKQMLAQVPAKEDAEDASMESYDAKHPDVVKVEAEEEKEEDAEQTKRASEDASSEDIGDSSEEDMDDDKAENPLDAPATAGVGSEEEGEEAVDGVRKADVATDPILTDSDAGDFEVEKQKVLSLSQSIADCAASCDGEDGCIAACKDVAKPSSLVGEDNGAGTQKKASVKSVKYVEEWQLQQAKAISDCKKSCRDSACKRSCEDPSALPAAPEPTEDSFKEVPVESGSGEDKEVEEVAGNGHDDKEEAGSSVVESAARTEDLAEAGALKQHRIKRAMPAFVAEAAYSASKDLHKSKTPTAQKVAYWEGLGSVKDRQMSTGRSLKNPAMPGPPRAASVAAAAQRTTQLEQINATPFYEGSTVRERNGGNPYAAGWSKVGGTNLDQVYKGIDAQLQPLAQQYPYLRSVRH